MSESKRKIPLKYLLQGARDALIQKGLTLIHPTLGRRYLQRRMGAVADAADHLAAGETDEKTRRALHAQANELRAQVGLERKPFPLRPDNQKH